MACPIISLFFLFFHHRTPPAQSSIIRNLSPAYDLTYSNSIGSEHATCVNENWRDPSLANILAVADKIDISKERAKRIAQQV